ncbi:MAG: hypothetical protein IJX01_03355 [Oscillospiraceae bacterium]|nr:hypothetical protein [Oscillospiraceae bacterium]
MRTKKNTISKILLIGLIFILSALAVACTAEKAKFDVISDVKNAQFKDFGTQTIEKAASSSLTELEWSRSEEPVAFDGGSVYEATLRGYSEEYEVNISIGFTVTYEYTQMADDPQPCTVAAKWVEVGDEYSESDNDLSYVLDYIYGNLS